MKTDAIKKYEFRKSLEELRAKNGQGTELVTIYIPPDKKIYEVTAQLKDEHGSASNIKSKSTRVNVQSALDSIISRLKYFKGPPANGMVIFSGTVHQYGDKYNLETIVVEPPQRIITYSYRCGSQFELDVLDAMLTEQKTFGLLVLDLREATIGLLRGKYIETVRTLTSTVPGKQSRWGQSAHRFEQLRRIAIHDFFKRIGDASSNIFIAIPPEELQGVLIGGPSPTKDDFEKGDYLHHEIRKKVVGLFDIAYTDPSGLDELIEASASELSNLDLIKEKNLMQRFMRELVSDKNLASYGEEQVRKNLEMGSVGMLLISEDIRRVRLTLTCPVDGHVEYRTVPLRPGEEPKIELNCPEDGTLMQVTETMDIVEEFSLLSDQMGTNVEFISTDFEEGAQLLNAFGGIAAILRYSTGI